MSPFISGAGWVTPLGDDLSEVWNAIRAGAPAPVKELAGPPGQRPHKYAPVPPKPADPLVRNPRLRRSSAISYFAATAGLAALADAGVTDLAAWGARGALIFAIGSGGVIYTRRFYEQIVRDGSASPLLFPETVYNAPASHLAAVMGVTGITYTLVGDATAGLSAVAFGQQLLDSGAAGHCLIVGAEEADWVLCEAYSQWHLAGNGGMLLADGAAAVVLERQGKARLDAVTDGVPFFRQPQAGASLETALQSLGKTASPKSMIASANGTFIDAAEKQAVASVFGELPAIFPKISLGESLGASALMQLICATLAASENSGSVLVPVIGLNHQAAAAVVSGA